MAAASTKHVTERDPVLFNEDLESFKCSKVGVETELGQGGELRGTVPSVGTMNQDIVLSDINSLEHLVYER